MGVVFLARHLQLRERVAIKVLKPDRGSHPGLVERLLREARAAASIRNRHVVRVIDVGTLPDTQLFIVMEYLEGEDLASLLGRSAPLPVPQAVDYVLEACEAVAEAHALGIVHRDLKPANLFLERRASGAFSVKVLDFGVARFLAGHADAAQGESGLTQSHSFVGSPAYVSPEQLTTPEDVDTRADIWALGLILYEMLSGWQPFKAPTLALTCTKILQERVPPLARNDVPPELTQALERALEKDRQQRFATLLELGAALGPHGSPAARASLAEIEAITQRGPSGASRAAVAKSSEPGSPTLTGSVLRARRSGGRLRARRLLVLPAAGVALLGFILWRAGDGRLPGIESKPTAASVVTAAASALPLPASAPSTGALAPSPATGPAAPVSSPASRVKGAPPRPGLLAAAAAQPSRAPVGPAASSAAPPQPSSDDSDRLYEFRK